MPGETVSWISILLGGLTGAVTGGAISFFTSMFIKREEIARSLLTEGLRITSLEDAWIPDNIIDKSILISFIFSDHRGLNDSYSDSNGYILKMVEVRSILDESKWNLPNKSDNYYGLVQNKATWIVRNQIEGPSYKGDKQGKDCFPAIMGSRSKQELMGWMEKVANANYRFLLDEHGVDILYPILKSLCVEDRRKYFEKLKVTKKAIKFLQDYDEALEEAKNSAVGDAIDDYTIRRPVTRIGKIMNRFHL